MQADWHLQSPASRAGPVSPEAENLRLSRAEVGRRIDRYSGEAPLFSIQQLHTSAGALPAAADVRLKILDSESYLHRFSTLIADLKEYLKTGYHVILGADSSRTRENLNKSLLKEGVDVPVVRTELSRGFHWPQAGLLLLASQELVGREAKKRRRKSEGGVPIEFFSDLAVGDLWSTRTTGSGSSKASAPSTSTGRKDFDDHVRQETSCSADGATLPVKIPRQRETVAPTCAAWGRSGRKTAPREVIKELAFDLRSRQAPGRQRPRLRSGHGVPEEFEARFPTETEDQPRRAESWTRNPAAMDRLLRGRRFQQDRNRLPRLFRRRRQTGSSARPDRGVAQRTTKLPRRMGEMPIRCACSRVSCP